MEDKNWLKIIGVTTILICLITWAMDWLEWVYPCPYCRTQRTVIGLLGLIMVLPYAQHWVSKWISLSAGCLGLVVAANQNFAHLKKLYTGDLNLGDSWYIHPFLLSGAAIFIIVGQLMLILHQKHAKE